MRPWLHRGAAAAVVAVLGLLFAPGLAAAEPTIETVAEPTIETVAEPGADAPARIELSGLSPRMVTGSSAPVIQVAGRVVNVGDRPITKLAIRLQRDEAVNSDKAVEQAVQGKLDAPQVTRFQPLPGELGPGQSRSFQLSVLLRGGADLESLQIDKPGVYPLLVNLNGQPDFGGVARLASVTLLLPVLGVPPATPGGVPGPVLRRQPSPTPLTVVWPLAATPDRVPSGPGEPVTLRSDRAGTDPLAAQIAPGGRLDGLLGAFEQEAPPGSPLGAAVCVAVDPLLLETLTGMSRGYRVSYPGGVSEGTGAQNARTWLDRLRAAVQGRCVLPLPYADADLVALSRAGLTDLEALAINTGIRLTADLLGVQPLTGVSWPDDGLLDERTLADLAGLQTHALLLDPHGIAPATPATAGGTDVVGLVGGSSSNANPTTLLPGDRAQVGLLIDPLLTSSLANTADTAGPPAGLPASPPASALSAQDGLGTLVYRATSGRPILLVPPRRWQARGEEANALLHTARQLLKTGFVAPRELPALAGTRAAGPGSAVIYPPQASAGEISPQVTAEVQRDRDILRDLQVATVLDPAANLRPTTLLDPLRLGLLRGVSTAWREQPDQAALTTAEESSRLEGLRRSVRIVQPPGPYSLAASDSPLLITVSNSLPVGVQVSLSLSETAGLRAGAVGLQLVPAHSTRQLVIPAKVSRAGQFSVDARLSTPGGTSLGEPSTLQLRSTAFGRVTVALTAGAGAVLILLVARRIVRRIRRTREAG